jgi:hypothetical protein
MTWGRWFQTADRHVGSDWFFEIHISTVFLGLNHNFIFNGPDQWFETMVFGPRYEKEWSILGKGSYWSGDDLFVQRYATVEQARAGHARAVAWWKERLTLSTTYQLQLCDRETEETETNEKSTSGSLPTEGT